MESIGLGGVLFFDTGNTVPEMGRATHAFAGLRQAAANLKEPLSKIGQAGQNLGLALAPVGLAFGFATKRAADFDQKLADIKAASPGLTNDALAQIEKRAKSLGASTSFSAAEAADAFLGLTKAGMDTSQAMSAVDGVLAAAAAEGIGLAQTTDIVTKAMGAFGLRADQAGLVADVLAQASASSSSSMEELGFALKFVGGTANTLGFSISDTAAALAVLTNAGIDSSTAGTALNGMLTELVDPSRKAKDILAMLGVQLTDSRGQFRSMVDLIPDLATSLDRFKSPAERTQAVVQLFGKEGARAFLALEQSLKNTAGGSLGDVTRKLLEAQGAAKKMADTRLDSFNGSLEKLKGAAETLLLEVFGPALPILRTQIERVSAVVDGLAERWSALSPSTRATLAMLIAGFGTFLAVAVPVIGALAGVAFFITGVVVPAVSGLAGVFAVLFSSALLPTYGMFLMIAAAFVIMRDRIYETALGISDVFFPVMQAFRETWKLIKEELSTIWGELATAFGQFTTSSEIHWRDVGRTIGTVVGGIVRAVLFMVRVGVMALSLWTRAWIFVGDILAQVFAPAVDMVHATIMSVILAFRELTNGSILTGLARFAVAAVDLISTPFRFLAKNAIEAASVFGFEAPAGLAQWADRGAASFIGTDAYKDANPITALALPDEKDPVVDKLDAMHNTLKDNREKPVNVNVKTKIDGRELALSGERHKREVGERTGFKANPYQRRLSVALGARPLGIDR